MTDTISQTAALTGVPVPDAPDGRVRLARCGQCRAAAPPAWTADALCAWIGGDLWYPEPGERALAAAAKQVCARCPARAACLEHALETGEVYHGIWGGLTPEERQAERRRRLAAAAAAACQQCGAPLPPHRLRGGWERRFCSSRCRSRDYRARRAAA